MGNARSFARAGSGSAAPVSALRRLRKGILDRQTFDGLAVAQAFTEQSGAACFQRGGDDQRVVEAVLITRLEVQSATIEFLAGRDGPEWEEHGVEKAPSLIRLQRSRDLPGEDVQGFLRIRSSWYT